MEAQNRPPKAKEMHRKTSGFSFLSKAWFNGISDTSFGIFRDGYVDSEGEETLE